MLSVRASEPRTSATGCTNRGRAHRPPVSADYVQPPPPLHVDAPGHSLSGSDPGVRSVQDPGVTSHARQRPMHGEPQHTPSTQNVLAHCVLDVQA
jgi:hypothetical protein